MPPSITKKPMPWSIVTPARSEKNPPNHPPWCIEFLRCRQAVRTTPAHSGLKDWQLCTVFAPIVNLTAPIQELWTTPTRPHHEDWHPHAVGSPIQELLIIAPSPHLKDLCPCHAVDAPIQELPYNSRIPCLRGWQFPSDAFAPVNAPIQELSYDTRTPCLWGWQVPFDAPAPPLQVELAVDKTDSIYKANTLIFPCPLVISSMTTVPTHFPPMKSSAATALDYILYPPLPPTHLHNKKIQRNWAGCTHSHQRYVFDDKKDLKCKRSAKMHLTCFFNPSCK